MAVLQILPILGWQATDPWAYSNRHGKPRQTVTRLWWARRESAVQGANVQSPIINPSLNGVGDRMPQ